MEMLQDPEVFRLKDAFGNLARLLGEDSVFALDGKEHMASRSVLAPAFSSTVFPFYLERIRERAYKTWERLVGRAEKFQLASIFQEHYFTVTIEMTAGVNMDGEKAGEIRDLFHIVQDSVIDANFGEALKEGQKAQKQLESITRGLGLRNPETRAEMIEELRKYADEPVKLGQKSFGKEGVDVLLVAIANSKLSTKKGAVNDEEVIDALCRSIVLLWFAGFATSSVTSMNASFDIGFNDSLRDALVAEQDQIVSNAAAGFKAVTYEQIKS